MSRDDERGAFWVSEHAERFPTLDECRPDNGAFIRVVPAAEVERLNGIIQDLQIKSSDEAQSYAEQSVKTDRERCANIVRTWGVSTIGFSVIAGLVHDILNPTESGGAK